MNAERRDSVQVGGGSMEQTHRYQPRALLFKILALVWVFPTAGALCIIGADWARWFRAATFLDGVRTVAFEQWIALVILSLHALFGFLALYFRRTEPFKFTISRARQLGHPDNSPGLTGDSKIETRN